MVGGVRRPRLVGRPLALMFVSTAGAVSSVFLLMSSVPLFVSANGAGDAGAGLSTGVLMLGTVLAEPLTPRWTRRFGPRAVTAAGLLLLGVPSLGLWALAAADSRAFLPVLALGFVRGAGLGIVVVVSTSVVADLAPEGRRSEVLGVYGVVVSAPGIAGLPLGVWLGLHVGYGPVFAAGALVALLPLAATPGLPSRHLDGVAHGAGLLAGIRNAGLLRPSLIFGATTVASGVMSTFLPLAMPPGQRRWAAVALFVQSCVTPVARWAAGRHGRSAALLVPSVVLAASGLALLVRVDAPVVALTAAALFGAGFGIAQNATLAVMFERVEREEFDTVSTLWNLAYDAGIGIGAVGFGFVAGGFDYRVGFAVTAAVMAAALVPALLDRRAARRA